jgi:hypothetical protein
LTDVALLVDAIAALVAAGSALLVYASDKILVFWKWLTARARTLQAFSRLDPGTWKLSAELREPPSGSASHLTVIGYAIPLAILGVGLIFSGVGRLETDLYGFGLYFACASVAMFFLSTTKVQELLSSGELGWANIRLRHRLIQGMLAGWLPALFGTVTGFLNGPLTFEALGAPVVISGIGLALYPLYLFYASGRSALRRIEDASYRERIVAKGIAPECEVVVPEGDSKRTRMVRGKIVAIGDVLSLRRDDGFTEEVEWHQVRSVAIKLADRGERRS